MNSKKILITIFVLIVLVVGGFFGLKLLNKNDEPIKLDTPVVTLNNDTATWEKIENVDKYEISINGNLSYVDNSITSKKLTSGDNFKVRAIGDGNNYLTSDWSNVVVYEKTNQNENSYTVTWLNGDTVLEVDHHVPYGTMPSYDGKTPEKNSNGDNIYVFVGWSPEVSIVTNDVTYTAIFESITNKYCVCFYDEDGVTLLGIDYVETGNNANYPNELPTKFSSEQYDYTFDKWVTTVSGNDEAILTNITSNKNVYASYKATLRKYLVKFTDSFGNVYSEEYVEYGSNATLPFEPFLAGYRFDNWDSDGVNITKETIITAQFTKIYEVMFLDYNNTILLQETVETLGTVDAPDASQRPNYKFVGWDQDFSSITSDLVIKPIYVRIYEVVVKDDTGNIIETLYCEENTSLTLDHDDKVGYHFIGWDQNLTNITSDLVVSPIYEINKYNVVFKSNEGEVLKYDVDGNLVDNSNIIHSMPASTPKVDKYWLDVNSGICYEFSGWYYYKNGEYVLFNTDSIVYDEIVTDTKNVEIVLHAKYNTTFNETLIYVDTTINKTLNKIISKVYLVGKIDNLNGLNFEISYDKNLLINDSSNILISTTIKNNYELIISEYNNIKCEYIFAVTDDEGIKVDGSICLLTIEFTSLNNETKLELISINDNCFIIDNNYNKIKPLLINNDQIDE